MNRVPSIAGMICPVAVWWKPDNVSAAIRYVVDEQGNPMAVFEATEP